jgi:antitoxin component YwqK of YwqJK toxin-antitoxin module
MLAIIDDCENGKKNGDWKYFDENGKLNKVKVYEDGRLVETIEKS